MINIDNKIQSLVSEILSEIKKELINNGNQIKINTKKTRVSIGSYKNSPTEVPVLTELNYDSINDIVYINCCCWIDYKIPLIGNLKKEPYITNVGKIDYIDYINIYKALELNLINNKQIK